MTGSMLSYPICKESDRYTPSNHWPVSLAILACKIIYHIVCKHILDSLEDKNILTSAQNGFRKGNSCENQLLITLTDFYKSIDSHIQVDVDILDFSRSFDIVPREQWMVICRHLASVNPHVTEFVQLCLFSVGWTTRTCDQSFCRHTYMPVCWRLFGISWNTYDPGSENLMKCYWNSKSRPSAGAWDLTR